MPRPITPPDRKDVNFSVKLPPIEMAFLEQLKEEMQKTAIADVVRDIIYAFRTTYSLPAYQAERLREDMRARNLNLIQYIQELLARRYEELSREPSPPSSASAAPPLAKHAKR